MLKFNYKSYFVFVVLQTLLIAGCAVHNGQITGNAALSGNNYKYVGTVSASNSCTYVFHWGGNAKKAQLRELKEKLQQRYPMRDGLAWANVTTEIKTGFYVIFDKRKATLTADIIDFWPDTNTTNAAYNGYYFNDSTFILIPVPIRNYTMKDSLEMKLFKLNAEKQKRNTEPLLPLHYNNYAINREMIFYLKKQKTIGIIQSLDSATLRACLAYLDNEGNVKITYRNFDEIFKY